RLKLREGRSGALVGSAIDTKAGGPRLDGSAQRDIKDELFGALDQVESNRLGGEADDDDGPATAARKGARRAGEDEGAPVARKGGKKAADRAQDEDARPRKFSRRSDDERGADRVDHKRNKSEDDDDAPVARKGRKKFAEEDAPVARKAASNPVEDEPPASAEEPNRSDDRRGKKRVASRDDEPAGEAEPSLDAQADGPGDAQRRVAPGERALDAVAGLSVTARRLTFASRPGLTGAPPSYTGAPVAGGMIDATIYPLALAHRRGGVLADLGFNVMYDRVFTVNTKDAMGKVYDSKESRFGVGAVFRHAFGHGATSPVVLGSLGYSSQLFSIASGTTLGIPSVKYSIVEPGAGLRFPVTPRFIAGLDARLMLITGTGQIQEAAQYGGASMLGFEGNLGVDYLITRNLFARVAFRFETIGFSFKGNGTLSNARDGDPMTTDVTSARDNYIGGMATLGYAY
ncbi:MAG TPA: hypothetical protein VFT22_24890, partial [Kofleriaceae bacterium]|nr:hypothetical protein [Kofleriaceae bacterium]